MINVPFVPGQMVACPAIGVGIAIIIETPRVEQT
jgi:hypothetical protein